MAIDTIQKLEDEIKQVFVVADKGLIKALAAAVISNRMQGDPVFMFIVANSSGGKTEFINMLNGLKFIRPIDTLTSNTFASGAPQRGGQQNSLLLKMQNGIITIKDFTTILEMNETARKEIMSQLRVIFDGTFNKETGLGDSIAWRGKIGMIAAVTTVIHQRNSEYKSMGERFVNYEIEQPPEEEVQKRVLQNTYDIGQKRKHLVDCFAEYVTHVEDNMEDDKINFPPEQLQTLMDISRYSTYARSGLESDPRDSSRILFIPDKEGPSRLLGQLFALGRAFIAMRRSEPTFHMHEGQEKVFSLTEDEMAILIKIALSSIPRKRRDALKLLAQYPKGVSTGGVAVKLGYNTMVIRATMYELNALRFCARVRDGMKDRWQLDNKWRDLILAHEKIEKFDEFTILEATDGGDEDYVEANDDIANKLRSGEQTIDNF